MSRVAIEIYVRMYEGVFSLALLTHMAGSCLTPEDTVTQGSLFSHSRITLQSHQQCVKLQLLQSSHTCLPSHQLRGDGTLGLC